MRHIIFVFAVITVLAGIILFFSSSRSRGDWKQISTSFTGITNLPRGDFAVISVSNDGNRAVMLRDSFEIEYVGIPPHSPVAGPGGAAFTNLIRLIPAGTNLVISGSRKADFLIPIPTNGNSWIARLEFAPAGLKTKVREHLIRQQDQLTKSLPPRIRGVPIHVVSQVFAAEETCGAKKLGRRPVQRLDRSLNSSLIASYARQLNVKRISPRTLWNAGIENSPWTGNKDARTST